MRGIFDGAAFAKLLSQIRTEHIALVLDHNAMVARQDYVKEQDIRVMIFFTSLQHEGK